MFAAFVVDTCDDKTTVLPILRNDVFANLDGVEAQAYAPSLAVEATPRSFWIQRPAPFHSASGGTDADPSGTDELSGVTSSFRAGQGSG